MVNHITEKKIGLGLNFTRTLVEVDMDAYLPDVWVL